MEMQVTKTRAEGCLSKVRSLAASSSSLTALVSRATWLLLAGGVQLAAWAEQL